MDHQAVYEALMARAVERDGIDGYVERHHIRPKSLFPDLKDDPSNIVILTAREHFIAHLLLAKIHGGVMAFAAHSMALNGRYGARRYAWFREEAAVYMSEVRKGAGNPMFGKKQSPEHVAKCVAARTGRPSPLKGRKISEAHRQRIKEAQRNRPSRPHSADTRERISRAKLGQPSSQKGVPLSIERRRHLSEINTGKRRTEEEKRRISASLKGQPKPPRSEDHLRNLAEANRRNGERKRLEYMENPKPSPTIRSALLTLSTEGGLTATDISKKNGIPIGTVLNTMRRMEAAVWVSVEWKSPTTAVTGRGAGRTVRRHYTLTPKGEAAALQHAA